MKNEHIEHLRYLSRKLVRELGVLGIDDMDSSMPPTHWHALIEIDKSHGITILASGSLLLISISKISRIIKSLTKEGFVEIKTGPDKREKYLYLTKAGKIKIEQIDTFSQKK